MRQPTNNQPTSQTGQYIIVTKRRSFDQKNPEKPAKYCSTLAYLIKPNSEHGLTYFIVRLLCFHCTLLLMEVGRTNERYEQELLIQ